MSLLNELTEEVIPGVVTVVAEEEEEIGGTTGKKLIHYWLNICKRIRRKFTF
jgi:hypothetical protein